MSRRSGLGRGLAALIPPSPPQAGDDGAPAPDADSPATASDDVAEPARVPDAATTERDEGNAPASRTHSRPAGSEPQTPASAQVTAVPDDPGRPPVGASDEMGEEAEKTMESSESFARIEPLASKLDSPAPPPPPSPDRAEVSPQAATLAEVAPSTIVANPRQPREVFDPAELQGLATSLLDVGVLQPLVVRPLDDGRYELVAGERRLRAALLAGLATVPIVIRHTEDANLLKEALVENIHRVQLNPLEEGAAYQQLLEEFGVTQDELASRLGRSRPAISNAIRLLQLPTDVQRRVASGVLSAGHAKVLLAIDDPTQQARLADRIVAEGMSVRATEELVRLRLLDGQPSTPSRRRIATAPGLVELQDDLSDALEARVRISMGARKGKLAIEFASVDDLERIVSVIANGLDGGRSVDTPITQGQPEVAGAGDPPDPS